MADRASLTGYKNSDACIYHGLYDLDTSSEHCHLTFPSQDRSFESQRSLTMSRTVFRQKSVCSVYTAYRLETPCTRLCHCHIAVHHHLAPGLR